MPSSLAKLTPGASPGFKREKQASPLPSSPARLTPGASSGSRQKGRHRYAE
jgi:hypothetical protein